jgi:bacterioferritin-associated ferredoxin
MIVCLCKGVSCRTIDAEVERGARTVGGIARACEAGTSCGMCVGQIRELIRLRTGDAADDIASDTVRP